MKTLADLLKHFKREYSDVVGVDIGSTGTKVVRIRRASPSNTVVAADILAPIAIPSETAENTPPVQPLQLDKSLRARHVALAISSPAAAVKILTVPTHSDKPRDVQVNELMGLAEKPDETQPANDHRLGYESLSDSRTETRLIAVSLPESQATALCELFPAGIPAPCSIEVAGLASMTAFFAGPGQQHLQDGVAAIDFGARVTVLAFFNKGSPVLIRKFDIGAQTILRKVQEGLAVDEEVALGILADGSFDVSQIVHRAMEPLIQQIVISRDFVDRREDCHVSRLYACGGGGTLKTWADVVHETTGLELVSWNPFEGLTVSPGAVPDRWKGQEARFSAAVGAALAMMGAR